MAVGGGHEQTPLMKSAELAWLGSWGALKTKKPASLSPQVIRVDITSFEAGQQN